MQSIEDLLLSLRLRSVKVWSENGQLRFRAPKGALRSEDINALRMHRSRIIESLTSANLGRAGPLRRRDAGCSVPLAANQMHWWKYIREHHGGWCNRMTTVAVRVSGKLNISLLRECIGMIVQRHDSLRTKFIVVGGEPRQHVEAMCAVDFDVTDLSAAPRPSADEEVQRLSLDFIEERIDPATGPLFGARLFRISDCEHVLVLALDHMITDALSNEILSNEIWVVYQQTKEGLPPSLPELPLQYADYALWQQQMYDSWRKEHEGYWRERLTGAPRTLLPCRVSSPEMQQSTSSILPIPFGPILSARLTELARKERVPLSLVALTVYIATMSRLCDQTDLVLSLVSHGRHWPELAKLVGYFANQLYLRVQIAKNDSLHDLLKRVSLEFRCAYDHQDLDRVPNIIPAWSGFGDLHFNWLPSPRSWSVVNTHYRSTADLELKAFSLQRPAPLKFLPYFLDTDAGIHVALVYNPDLYGMDTIEQFSSNIRLFAEVLAQNPLTRLTHIRTPEQ